MKTLILFLSMAAILPLSAQPAPAPASNPATDSALPSVNYTASRYETLWTKSPFAVETAEENTASSPDYMLVGIATIGGVSYASVIERQDQEHFLISTEEATRGLKLLSLKPGENGGDTFATVQKDGQTLTLKLEQPPANAPGVAAVNQPGQGVMAPQITMPGAGQNFGGMNGGMRPFPRVRRPLIHLPNQPAQNPQPVPAAAPAPPPPPPPAP
jgi:hypothetical protein